MIQNCLLAFFSPCISLSISQMNDNKETKHSSHVINKDNYNINNNIRNSSVNSFENNCSSRIDNILGVFMCHEELNSLK